MSQFEESIPSDWKDLISYCPETGDFTWKAKPARRIAVGSRAGNMDGKGYWQITVKGRTSFAHRLAWEIYYGVPPCMDIDHINGNPLDNRIANLRLATPVQNMANHALCSRNTSGVKGLYQLPSGSWMGRVSKAGKIFRTKIYKLKADAESAVISLRITVHGEFANHGDFAPEQQKSREVSA